MKISVGNLILELFEFLICKLSFYKKFSGDNLFHGQLNGAFTQQRWFFIFIFVIFLLPPSAKPQPQQRSRHVRRSTSMKFPTKIDWIDLIGKTLISLGLNW